jgi:integrase
VRIQRQDYPAVAKSFVDLKVAKRWALKTESEMERGVFMHANPSGQLSQCLQRYQQDILPTKKNPNADWYRINRLCNYPIASKHIKNIKSHDVAELRDTLIKEKKSANTIRLYLAILSHLFTIAKTEWGYEGINNPVLRIRKPRLPQSRDTRLTNDDIHLICQKSQSSLLPLLIHMALDTAMRVSEIVNLKVTDCNFKERMITVRNTKNYHDRYIPMTKKVSKILKHQTRLQRDKLFNITSHGVSVAFYRACKRAGIPNTSFHTLRHEAVSRLFEKGLNPMEVATISGHQSMQMLKRYTHIQTAHLLGKMMR